MRNAYVRTEGGGRRSAVQVDRPGAIRDATRRQPSILAEHPITATMRDSLGSTLSTPPRFVYLDVGCWKDRDRRDFGAIYGNERGGYVVLCRYVPEVRISRRHSDMAPPGPGRSESEHTPSWFPGEETRDEVSGTLVRFFQHCQANPVEFARVQSLNTRGKIYVLLGDLHLPLVARDAPSSRVDSIESKWIGDASYRVGLDDDMISLYENVFIVQGRTFHDLRNIGLIDPPQIGDDWYRVYTEGDIFSPRGETPSPAAVDLDAFLGRLESWDRGGIRVHLVQLGDMFEFWIGLRPLFDESREEDWRTEIGRRRIREARPRRDRFTVAEHHHVDIQNWLNCAYRTTRVNGRPLADRIHHCQVSEQTWIYGNHDNYLHCYPGEEIRFQDSETRPAMASGSPAPGSSRQYERPPRRNDNYYFMENDIRMEHGHQGDEFNRDGAITGHDITQACFALGPWTRSLVPDGRDQFIAYGASRYYAHRQRDRGNMRVFVMAHTHAPLLDQINVFDVDYAVDRLREYQFPL